MIFLLDLPRVKSAHGVIALQTTVHDSGVSLLSDTFFGDLGVNPVGETPHVRTNLAELDGSRGVVLDSLLEGRVEVVVVEEDVRVVVPSVEMALNRLDGLNHTIQLLVTRKDDESAVGTRFTGIGLQAACLEDLIILFAYFSAGEQC